MRTRQVIGVVMAAFMFGVLGGQTGAWLLDKDARDAAKETAHERVIRTQTLRCGYVVHPPHVIKDPATGALSGSIVDIMNEAGRLLNIRVEWPEEVGWGNSVEALRSGRVDAVCTDFWMNPVEGRYVSFSMPLYYEAVVAYGRADDRRFLRDLGAVNDPSVTIAATDGAINGIIAEQDFPKAKVHALPNMTDTAQILSEVAAGKSDVAFVAVQDGLAFTRNNPGKLIKLTVDRPLRAFAATIAVPQKDAALKGMLDSAFAQLLYGRFIDNVLDKHGMPPDAVYRVARPYDLPAASVGSALPMGGESVTMAPLQ